MKVYRITGVLEELDTEAKTFTITNIESRETKTFNFEEGKHNLQEYESLVGGLVGVLMHDDVGIEMMRAYPTGQF